MRNFYILILFLPILACKKEESVLPPPANQQPEFACGDLITDSRDDQQYGTVQIGDQCWFSQNLNIGQVTLTINQDPSDNDIIEKYCFGDLPQNCDTEGGLYAWNELMGYSEEEGVQGICPDGWHVPAIGKFSTLVDFADGVNNDQLAGNELKAVGEDKGATDDFGFSALLSGAGDTDFDAYVLFDTNGIMFSSTSEGVNARTFALVADQDAVFFSGAPKVSALGSVRCIMDN